MVSNDDRLIDETKANSLVKESHAYPSDFYQNYLNKIVSNLNVGQKELVNLGVNKFNIMRLLMTLFYNPKKGKLADNYMFNRLSKLVYENFEFDELNMNKYKKLIQSPDWKNFEKENFNSKICGNEFYYCIMQDSRKRGIKIILAGKKDSINQAKEQIKYFISENEPKTQIIRVKEDEVKSFF